MNDEVPESLSAIASAKTARASMLVFIPVAAFCWGFAGCTTYFTDGAKLPCVITHRVKEGELVIRAEVTNRSDRTVTFVDHPDFHGTSVTARDRGRDRAENVTLISHVRATPAEIVAVRPGEKFVVEEHYGYRRLSPRMVQVTERWPFGTQMTIWDTHLRAEFRYGTTLEYLPACAWLFGRNYVMHPEVLDLESRDSWRTELVSAFSVFRAP